MSRIKMPKRNLMGMMMMDKGGNGDDLSDDEYDDLDDYKEQMDIDVNAGKDSRFQTPSVKQSTGTSSKTVAMECG
jgi:hypothetical protein